MKIDKTKKITGVCSKALDSKFNLMNPYLHGDRLLASHGHICISIKIEPDTEDTDGFIPVDAIKQSPTYIDAIDPRTVTTSNSVNMPRVQGDFPTEMTDDIIKKAHDGTFEIALNAKYLLALAKGMGAFNNEIRLKFKGKNDPILVRANNINSEDEAIIMPVTLAGVKS